MVTDNTAQGFIEKIKVEARAEVIDELIRHLNALRAAPTFGEGPSLTGMGLGEAAKEIVKEIGPRGTREIAHALLARGVRTNSKNFVATVYTTLKSSPDFIRNGGTWELAKRTKK